MEQVREILEWYVDAGVDTLLEEAPVDRFAESEVQTAKITPKREANLEPNRPKTKVSPPAQAAATAVPDAEQVNSARTLAQSAMSLEELRSAIETFEGCNLKRTARSTVFADGNPEADIMFVGEAPGRDEDLQGLPFVGRAGQLLDLMLAAIGLDRQTAYITNIVPWRPPGNRTPTPQETEICRPFIERHIELVDPKVLVMLGGSSAKTLLKTTDGIMRLRGKWKDIGAGSLTVNALPTLHPAYLLRQPGHKRLAWQDFLQVAQKIRGKPDP